MNTKLILLISILLMVVSVSSVAAIDNSTDLASSDDMVLAESDDEPNQYVETKIVADSIIGEDGDTISVPVEILDEDENPVMNGTATLVIGDMVYGSFVENGTAVFQVEIHEGMTKAYITYYGNEYYDSCELELDIFVVHESYSEIPIEELDDSLNVTEAQIQPSVVKAATDSKATGNPIFAVMLSLMVVSLAGVINRRR